VFLVVYAPLRECSGVGALRECTGGTSQLYDALVFAAFLGALSTAAFLTFRRLARRGAAKGARSHGFA
jgi:hypothetical protein